MCSITIALKGNENIYRFVRDGDITTNTWNLQGLHVFFLSSVQSQIFLFFLLNVIFLTFLFAIVDLRWQSRFLTEES